MGQAAQPVWPGHLACLACWRAPGLFLAQSPSSTLASRSSPKFKGKVAATVVDKLQPWLQCWGIIRPVCTVHFRGQVKYTSTLSLPGAEAE